MTQKQKEAIELIIRERNNGHLIDSEFYTLLDFIIEQTQQQVQYIPYYPWNTNYNEPHPFIVTCGGTSTTLNNEK